MSILSTFKKYKDYILTENGYQLSSRWTKSDAVVMGDGTDDTNTLESNLGAIKGITSDLACEDTNVAASMSAVGAAITELNNNLVGFIGSSVVDGGSNVPITSGLTVVAPEDCWLFLFNFYSTGNNIYGAAVSIDGAVVMNNILTSPASFPPIPVKKGQTIVFGEYCIGGYNLFKMLK